MEIIIFQRYCGAAILGFSAFTSREPAALELEFWTLLPNPI